ncbi:hypothetical protein B0H13DRAFT_1884602 [Mycena leptocephala]|nr:hypothetical protein B0H13DRAFT_1884602 [Mycena leptocephala]
MLLCFPPQLPGALKVSKNAIATAIRPAEKTVSKPIHISSSRLIPSPSAKDLKPYAPNPGDEEEVDEKRYKTRHRPEEKQSVHDSDPLTEGDNAAPGVRWQPVLHI